MNGGEVYYEDSGTICSHSEYINELEEQNDAMYDLLTKNFSSISDFEKAKQKLLEEHFE